MRIQSGLAALLCVVAAGSVLAPQQAVAWTHPAPVEAERFAIFAGTYQLADGRTLTIVPHSDRINASLSEGSFLDYADNRIDPRLLAVEARTAELMDASIAADLGKVAQLLGVHPIDDLPYIEGHMEIIAAALAAYREHGEYQVVATTYRDEDSDYGFEDQSWGWETYVRFEAGEEDEYVRISWDGMSGLNMHRGTGRMPPELGELAFTPRAPSRSWIRVYDPKAGITQRVREMAREDRDLAIPARFIAYDIDTHVTVGIRFRKPEADGAMHVEIGPLGSDVLVMGERMDGQNQ